MGTVAFARTCYDHLAGTLGVAIRDGMVRPGLVTFDDGPALTAHGREVLRRLGVVVPSGGRRPLRRDCLDWTERREHPAGALPAALPARAGWLMRDPPRVVRVRASAPFTRLGIDPAELAA